ncbi:MAG: methyltransferase domain-containing protein [Deltaproteobacteria bacterium]|nr:methyltransferase domain-containing protein [Deltaproteobacteria bacterium]
MISRALDARAGELARRYQFKERLKWLLFPGVNLHTRDRYRRLPPKLGRGDRSRLVLDAGCGNGMLAYQAWLRGNRVVGVTFHEHEATSCRRLFHDHLRVPPSELDFRLANLKEVDKLRDEIGPFDEIVCTEVIEHIRDDKGVCEAFFRVLEPGGILHLTTPNAEHPYNATFPLDLDEGGGHVRAGYTQASFRALLEPIGFVIEGFEGLGGPIRQAFSSRIKSTQERFGTIAGFPVFVLSLPALPFDDDDPAVPFSIYVRARKPST